MGKVAILIVLGLTGIAQSQGSSLDYVKVPDTLFATELSGPKLTPCVSCLCAAATGEVYAGVDQIGSLGKGGGKGRVIRLVDRDGDGVAEGHTLFATIDNPRGMFAVGDRLYILHTQWDGPKFEGMHLSVLTDADGDGVADGPPQRLVAEISARKHNQDRGVDHTTNGIRMGIDGWIYVAVGDFGFVDATGTDGRKLTMYGGGIVRVRPDGTELETYTHGLRNIYDTAIDPFMNIFTRGNTNDGGGWNIRFIHQVQSGEYGYPVLFKRYTSEILPALVDLGGGSGTGAIFFDEPGWPEAFTGVPMMCDWGRSAVLLHPVTPDGASFTQEQVDFIRCSKVTDIDCDGSGRLYLGSWHGSGYKGGDGGFVARVTPKNWEYVPFPDLPALDDSALVELLDSASATARLHAQQELLSRGGSMDRVVAVLAIADEEERTLAGRVAALWTLAQFGGVLAEDALLSFTKVPELQEQALRALADRPSRSRGVPPRPFLDGLGSDDPRVQVAAAVGIGRLAGQGRMERAAAPLLAVSTPAWSEPLPEPDPEVEVAYKSAVVGKDDTVSIDVEIAGFDRLVLAIGDGGDGTGSDHGAWFDPILVTAAGEEIPLTSLDWTSATQGWGQTLKNKGCTGGKLVRHDRAEVKQGIGSHSPSVIVYEDLPEEVVRFRATGAMNASGRGTVQFLVAQQAEGLVGDSGVVEGPHATPNSAQVLPHVATRSLVQLGAVEACLEAIGGTYEEGGLRALQGLHRMSAVDGLIAALERERDVERRDRLLSALVRLSSQEWEYDGSTWWGTRPDTRGPHYYPTAWEGTAKIAKCLQRQMESGGSEVAGLIQALVRHHRAPLDDLGGADDVVEAPAEEGPTADLEAISAGEGEVGGMAVEDVLLALEKTAGDAARGRQIFTNQGCAVCHSLTRDEPLKGPYMGQVGAIMDRERIALSILRPADEISQGFKTVMIQTKDGGAHVGFVSERLSDKIELRNIAGVVTTLDPRDIVSEQELDITMMPPGLANSLSIEDFASLVAFLEAQKE